MKVNVVDSIMGSGKTSAMINMINDEIYDSGGVAKFMYITPYLDEVTRIKDSCKSAKFREPKPIDGSKVNGIKYLLKNDYNIVSTHSLFHLFDDEIFDLIHAKGYTLIMDEVTDVITEYNMEKQDVKIIFEDNLCHVDENNYIVWDREDYTRGKFLEFKNLCDMNALQMFGETIVMWLFPIKSFEAFEDIYILTYMFNGQIQKWYYDYYGIEYNWYKAVRKNNRYCIEKGTDDSVIDKKLLDICDHRINNIGDKSTALSKSWYVKSVNNGMIETLKNNTLNYFTNIIKAKSSDILWTTFKGYEKKIKGKGYAKGFISVNLRASNNYRDRSCCAYLVNRFVDPVIKQFFISNGVNVNEDLFALSEMLQWIWRSCIRDGKLVQVYIPSKRMRDLLINWLEHGTSYFEINDNVD